MDNNEGTRKNEKINEKVDDTIYLTGITSSSPCAICAGFKTMMGEI
jgi:hypothetical protein